MSKMEGTSDELKRNNPPPKEKQGSGELKNKHISEELTSTTHQQHTNMKDMIE